MRDNVRDTLKKTFEEYAVDAVHLIGAAFTAWMAGVVIRLFIGVPIRTTASAILFFYVLQFMEARCRGGVRVAISWSAFAARAAVAYVIFLALRFLLGQVTGLYPTYAYDGWGANGGFRGIFWGE